MKKSFWKRMFFCGALGMLSLAACGVGEEQTEEARRERAAEREWVTPVESVPLNEIPQESIAAYEDFAMELLRNSVRENANSMISPASVYFAMDMAALGAEGDTLLQMTETLSPGVSWEDTLLFSHSFMRDIYDSESVTFYVANSLWAEENVIGDSLNEAYETAIQDYFNAEIHVLPFDESAVSQMNRWVNDSTYGMINRIMDEISEEEVLYLLNAVAFDAKWEDEYTESSVAPKDFTNDDGTVVQAEALHSTENIYFETADAIGTMIYYEGMEYAFLAILPAEGMGADEYVASLTGERYREFWNSRTNAYRVHTQIPCFTYEYSVDMTQTMQDMGMELAFDEENADFSGMTDSTEFWLYLNGVRHMTFIEVDATGTRAAAVTSVSGGAECVSEEVIEYRSVILNRPFVYAIVDVETGLPVFMGTVNQL
ncbi:MAG: hypothetical protein E7285_00950 [Lachnospiraceae bacterium]|nr:hypothetical protein [Lachnospiraceae bacterium]